MKKMMKRIPSSFFLFSSLQSSALYTHKYIYSRNKAGIDLIFLSFYNIVLHLFFQQPNKKTTTVVEKN